MSGYLRLDTFERTPLVRDPFEFVVVPGFLDAGEREALDRDYPRIDTAGSHPVNGLTYGPAFAALLDEMQGPAFRDAVARKFGLDLDGRPTIVTARGRARARDGRIHTDTDTKIITVLLYMNADHWPSEGGRLRLLRSGGNLDDVAREVAPDWGSLIVFRRSERSFHGHKPFEGPRRVLQLNWVTDQSVVDRELHRHGITARLKRVLPWAGGY